MGKLIDADKLLEYINGSPLGYANDNFIESLELKINIGQFAPDPIPLPALKPGDKVRHKDHEQWGIGKVLELSKSKKSAECRFEYTTTGTLGTFRRFEQAFYRLDKLELVEDKEDE